VSPAVPTGSKRAEAIAARPSTYAAKDGRVVPSPVSNVANFGASTMPRELHQLSGLCSESSRMAEKNSEAVSTDSGRDARSHEIQEVRAPTEFAASSLPANSDWASDTARANIVR
jgi:hypothetical protein